MVDTLSGFKSGDLNSGPHMKSILPAKPILPSSVFITWNPQNRLLSTRDLDRGSQIGKGFFIAHLIVHAALGDINRGQRSRATESTDSPQCRQDIHGWGHTAGS